MNFTDYLHAFFHYDQTGANRFVYGFGSGLSLANIVNYGLTTVTVVGPIMLGAAALWQAKTARDKFEFEKQKYADERKAVANTVVTAQPAHQGESR